MDFLHAPYIDQCPVTLQQLSSDAARCASALQSQCILPEHRLRGFPCRWAPGTSLSGFLRCVPFPWWLFSCHRASSALVHACMGRCVLSLSGTPSQLVVIACMHQEVCWICPGQRSLKLDERQVSLGPLPDLALALPEGPVTGAAAP